ncbi:hypothetical protein LTR36_002337 [Oleoguttula mirabilis]|uniref:DUF8004 domain-containing protein n=1 Tax=Oleoguttula mirabilis TaxID=1507867 RepID=A0AAV9JLT3_9PEZI|nr:hypothetical protein LTR36_002337 [Oleoguttula mirabilis]
MGASQRGPSFRLRYADIEALRSEYLLEHCRQVRETSSPLGAEDTASSSGSASPQTSRCESRQCELYIPAPTNLTREQAYAYHLTTRNFFAYAAFKPIVGHKLGVALAELLDRIREWQPKTAALANFTSYCQHQGYEDMAQNADYAIACLTLAEHAKRKDLWVESFVHCVGMHEQLEHSAELDSLSNTTKALISRASLEMDLHIERVVRALGSFLEEELGPEQLGLTKPAREHLDRFRSCLHNYYVEKLGYYPPTEEGPWNKRLWTKMYHAFLTLYEYLVDTESSTDPSNSRALTGGICVVQNVRAFDERHGYTSLPHPMPLLPALPTPKRAYESQKGLRSFRLGRQDTAASERLTAKEALAQASNSHDAEVTACELVQEYQRFERQKLEEKLSVAEARKVRWLLVYGVLQMLVSITRAPKEVRDTETPTYPLCVLTVGCPAFEDGTSGQLKEARSQYFVEETLSPHAADDNADKISIHPDCEAENAEGYFAADTISRRPSQLSFDLTPSPLRITSQISRTASIRSSVHALHKSFVGSLGRRSTASDLRRVATAASSRPLSTSSSFCEILIEGYGNGAGGDEKGSPLQTNWVSEAEEEQDEPDEASNHMQLAGFDFGLGKDNGEPILEDRHIGDLAGYSARPLSESGNLERSPSDSSLSATDSSTNSGSTRSSTYTSASDSPATDFSFWDSDASQRNSAVKLASSTPPLDLLHRETTSADGAASSSRQPRPSWQQKRLNFGRADFGGGGKASGFSVNAGCYTPTGRPMVLPLSKFSAQQRQRGRSVDSIESLASCSRYAEHSGQAGEIEEEEEEMRGRRRSRGLDMAVGV